MCTGVILGNNKLGINLFSRNLDWTDAVPVNLIYIPKEHQFQSMNGKEEFTVDYPFFGMGYNVPNYLFGDGINEEGLVGAMFNFSSCANYNDDVVEGKVNLAATDLLKYILGKCKNVSEIKEIVNDINVIRLEDPILKTELEIHWIFTDRNGDSLILEPLDKKLKVCDVTVGVFTNSPSYDWHLTNLRNYLNFSPVTNLETEYSGEKFTAMGHGNGTFGIPGSMTPVDRFIRATVGRDMILKKEEINSTLDAIKIATKILNNVSIPKGYMEMDGHCDFTLYQSFIDCKESKYYYQSYNSNSLACFSLDKFKEHKKPFVQVIEDQWYIKEY